MRRSLLAVVPLLAACSTSSGAGPGAADGSLTDTQSESAADAAVEGGDDAPACVCLSGGSCDSFGCPPDYNAASFAAWCNTVQAGVNGHTVITKTCGTLLLLTYGTGTDCEKGYVFDQTNGQPLAALAECNTPPLGCAALGPALCMLPCCLDGTCTLGIPSLCPAWQPPADGGPSDAAGGGG